MNPINLIKKRMAGQSMSKTAVELGVSPAYLCMVLKGKREIGPTLLDALGVERKVKTVTQYYRRRA